MGNDSLDQAPSDPLATHIRKDVQMANAPGPGSTPIWIDVQATDTDKAIRKGTEKGFAGLIKTVYAFSILVQQAIDESKPFGLCCGGKLGYIERSCTGLLEIVDFKDLHHLSRLL